MLARSFRATQLEIVTTTVVAFGVLLAGGLKL
jgi:hypothetical protein